MDIVNDEEEKDTSFVPRKIIDHRISRQPRREVHKLMNGETLVQVVQKTHLRVNVLWKNRKIF